MTVFKCKMCGGSIDVVNNESVAECEYCGTKQTLPTAQDENLQALFNRANQLRMKSEFDRAETLYEKIIQNKPDEPEAHWGLILCKFGIEYVEDPKTFKRIPTCHRTSFDSITADDDYKEALKYSDSIQRTLYENEAKEIDRIQKEILALSNKEEPYDVFICYKETDENGQRTPDSAIANDIYHQLTNEDFKVFYAAISLEDKLGSAYEPCIFAALNSSKVMLAIGTKPEYFNSVWVKNEWSRFLKMMKNDKSKLLIPCYKGMDAYDLPDDFAHLQAQDMSKIGFINDIVRGIKKVIVKDKPKTENSKTVVVNTPANANVQSLLRRVFIFLEDGDFKSADEYCEKVLDIEPENARAYLGKLMAELRVNQEDELEYLSESFEDSSNYQKIMKFGDNKIKYEVESYIDCINKRNYLEYCEEDYQEALAIYEDEFSDRDELTRAKEIFENISDYKDSEELIEQYDAKVREHEHNINERDRLANLERTYQKAYGLYKTSNTNQIEKAKEIFESLSSYQDSNEMVSKCDEKIKELQNSEKYKQANNLVSESKSYYDTFIKENIIEAISKLDEAEEIFVSLGNYQSSKSIVETCRKRKQEYQVKIKEIEIAKKRAEKNKKIVVISSIMLGIVIVVIIVVNTVILPSIKYNNAVAMLENGQYDEATTAFTDLGDYKDSSNKISESKYLQATKLFEEKKYDEAITIFKELGDYKDSVSKITEIKYLQATKLFEERKYNEAITTFEKLGDYKDSSNKISESKYLQATKLFEEDKYDEAITAFNELGNYKDSLIKMEKAKKSRAEFETAKIVDSTVNLIKNGDLSGAAKNFEELSELIIERNINPTVTFDKVLKDNISKEKYDKYKSDFQKYKGLYIVEGTASPGLEPNNYNIKINEENWTFAIHYFYDYRTLSENAEEDYPDTFTYVFPNNLGYYIVHDDCYIIDTNKGILTKKYTKVASLSPKIAYKR